MLLPPILGVRRFEIQMVMQLFNQNIGQGLFKSDGFAKRLHVHGTAEGKTYMLLIAEVHP
jgi:hypothetical protein